LLRRLVARQFRPRLLRLTAALAIAGIVGAVFVFRVYHALDDIIPFANSVYRIDYHVAHFLQEFYPAATVVAHDIGQISFQADVRLLDLWGLANRESLDELRSKGRLTPDFLDRWAQQQHARVAVVRDILDSGIPAWQLPVYWVRIGEWLVPNDQFWKESVITFYAVGPDEVSSLSEAFEKFADVLPSGVSAVQNYHEP
jgi:hypothetical protein